jgi:precorrin-8X/cobalt-precorrin-8 methylmutase
MKTGVIILGHGSKSDAARETLDSLAKMVSLKSGRVVEFACLQFNSPTLSEAIAQLVEKKIKRIAIVPLFLFNGNHMQRDIPKALEEEAARHKGVELLLARHLGADWRIAEVLMERLEEVFDAPKKHASNGEEYFDQLIQSPKLIEDKSLEIIEKGLPGLVLPAACEIVKRVVHATGDFSIATSILVSEGAIASGLRAIECGASILTDVKMVKAGINSKLLRFGGKIRCLIDDPLVADQASIDGKTRAATAMKLAADSNSEIIAIGNAPTALFEILNLIEKGQIKPALVIGTPVGFVGAQESKEKLMESNVSYITVKGTRGGSTVAVAIVNALLKMANTSQADSQGQG